MPAASTVREALTLLAVSFFLGFTYNAVVGKGIFGPTRPSSQPSSSTADLPSTEIISIDQAKQIFDDGEGLFIDTRHAFDFRLGHIPGAVNVPLKEAKQIIAAFGESKDRTLIVYCDGAECNSSLEVGSMFFLSGYRDVKVFFSGWTSWKDMGYDIEEATP